ncbi:hypothetical protein Q8W71_04875 [Methylobacterium sp. NEAU 140]|uniref:hypothetical protein n=1 Tax=Methylobacterium sp. NEAU 140 TaxID=3064945 RepID=UPI002734701B|nr:hypothetical protein [Methylobacterium sp. NEAU 140]MDP4021951.1 hypothetical protein [Methylobacterium sp. NEAU 140]
MRVVAFMALCFSAPVGMILFTAWTAATGWSGLVMADAEVALLIAATASTSVAFALGARSRSR